MTIGKYEVVTLCGSTRFKDDFLEAQKILTLTGHIVLSVGLFGHADGEYDTVITPETKDMLDDMHKRKIDMSDSIFVINRDDYIGESTRSEIEYALSTGKQVSYMFKHEENPTHTKSCFGMYSDEDGNICATGAAGLCSECVECRRACVHV